MKFSPGRVMAISLSVVCGAAQADEPPMPLWEVGLLGGAASTPAYPASSDRSARALLMPFVIYRGAIFRSDQSGVGARLLATEHAEVDLGLALSLPARSDNVEARRGMPNLGTLLEFGPRLKVELGERLRLEAPLRAVIEVNRGLHSQGLTFEPKIVYETPYAPRGANLDLYTGLVFGDARVNRYFYEVAPAYANAQRPAFRAEGGLMMLRAGINGWSRLSDDWRVFGFARYDHYGSARNRASALFRQDTGWSVGFGMAWTWKRSQALAKD